MIKVITLFLFIFLTFQYNISIADEAGDEELFPLLSSLYVGHSRDNSGTRSNNIFLTKPINSNHQVSAGFSGSRIFLDDESYNIRDLNFGGQFFMDHEYNLLFGYTNSKTEGSLNVSTFDLGMIYVANSWEFEVTPIMSRYNAYYQSLERSFSSQGARLRFSYFTESNWAFRIIGQKNIYKNFELFEDFFDIIAAVDPVGANLIGSLMSSNIEVGGSYFFDKQKVNLGLTFSRTESQIESSVSFATTIDVNYEFYKNWQLNASFGRSKIPVVRNTQNAKFSSFGIIYLF